MTNTSYVYRAFISAAFLMGGCISSGPSTEGQESAGTAEQALSPAGQADVSSDGPFTNTQALIDYWRGTSTSGARTQIYVNGRNVLDRSGFGPAFVKEYFACSGGGIYAVCPSGFLDGYTNFNTLVSKCPTVASIYKDGVLFRSGTSNDTVNISTCSGDQSFYGLVQYYKVISYMNGFVPYFGSCYP